MKKLFAVLLAVVMLLSLSATAFATGKITVANAPPSTSYAAYQIFDASVVDDKVVYTLAADSLWVSKLIDTTDGSSKFENLEFIKNAHGDYVVIAETGFSAPDFADFLVADMASVTPVISQPDPATAGLAEGQKTHVILNLKDGYYLVRPIDEVETEEKTEAGKVTYKYIGSEKGTTTDPTNAALYDAGYYIDGDGNVIPATAYNALTGDGQAKYSAYWLRKAEINDTTFKALDAAEQLQYQPNAQHFTFNSTEDPITQGAYNAKTDAEKALYKVKEEVWYNPNDLNAVIEQTDFSADDWAMILPQLIKGNTYERKTEITASEFMALNGKTAEIAKYDPKEEDVNTVVPKRGATITAKEGATPVLTTVLDGQNVQVQNKNDMPLDKTVEKDGVDVDKQGVNVGDELNYTIATKIPVTDPKKDVSIYRVWDTMSEGLTLKDYKIKITIEANGADNPEIVYELTYNPATGDLYEERATLTEKKTVGGEAVADSHDFTLVYDGSRELTGNEIRFEPESEKGYTFELSLAVASEPLKNYQTRGVKIEYVGVVNDKAVAELLINAASLVYEDDNGNTWIKDDETDNYISRIIVDKYDSTNPTQKLTGAEFRLYWQPTQAEIDEIEATMKQKASDAVLNAAYQAAYDEAKASNLSELNEHVDSMNKSLKDGAPAALVTAYTNAYNTKLNELADAAVAAAGNVSDARKTEIRNAALADDANKDAAKDAGIAAVNAKIAELADAAGVTAGDAAKNATATQDAAAEAAAKTKCEYKAGTKYYYQLNYLTTTVTPADPEVPGSTETVTENENPISYARYTDDDGLVYDQPLKVVGDNTNTLMPKGADGYAMYENLKVKWVEDADAATKVVTDANGFAQFGYLQDGTYQLEETKAPIDYTKLLSPKEIVVDGSDATDKSLNASQRVDALTNIAYVENTPGTSLPSTGGVGATMMTIGGIALILAAGAFLVLRRRKEQE